MDGRRRRWDLRHAAGWVAILCAGANALAAVGLFMAIRRGSASVPDLHARLFHIAHHRVAWVVAWSLWIVAALSLLLLYIVLALTLSPRHRPTAWMTVAAAGIGFVTVLASVILSVLAPPRLSDAYFRAGLTSLDRVQLAASLHAIDRSVVVLTGFVGIGLYATAGAILNAIALATPEFPKWLGVAGAATWAVGFGVAALALVGSATGLVIATDILAPCLVLWAYGVGAFYFWRRDPERPPSAPNPDARQA